MLNDLLDTYWFHLGNTNSMPGKSDSKSFFVLLISKSIISEKEVD